MTRVKICGITRLEDALAAVDLGAHALGLNFWPKSKRFIHPNDAEELVAGLPPMVSTVGIFVNQPWDEVEAIASRCRLSAVQLHGDETPEQCDRFRTRVIKAIRVENARSLRGLSRYDVQALLFDAPSAGFGGSGATFDWKLLRKVATQRPVLLAGGLTPKNVASAIRAVRPYAVDVASGVESEPGKKDLRKLRAFMRAVQETR